MRRAIESYPSDLRVIVMGTGGLSHQLYGEEFGTAHPEWDNELQNMLAELIQFTELSLAGSRGQCRMAGCGEILQAANLGAR
ncbi:MAG: hypothetical protein JO227_11665 [Acetobacteraceae bacterium]|nr:hypothetical protein [Acetobacteraceae bacterium]